jgi:hypothetical protein
MEYKQIANYNNLDGSTTEVKGGVSASGKYYTINTDDSINATRANVSRTEAMVLVIELERFISS